MVWASAVVTCMPRGQSRNSTQKSLPVLQSSFILGRCSASLCRDEIFEVGTRPFSRSLCPQPVKKNFCRSLATFHSADAIWELWLKGYIIELTYLPSRRLRDDKSHSVIQFQAVRDIVFFSLACEVSSVLNMPAQLSLQIAAWGGCFRSPID